MVLLDALCNRLALDHTAANEGLRKIESGLVGADLAQKFGSALRVDDHLRGHLGAQQCVRKIREENLRAFLNAAERRVRWHVVDGLCGLAVAGTAVGVDAKPEVPSKANGACGRSVAGLTGGPDLKIATIARSSISLLGLAVLAALLAIAPACAKNGELRQKLVAPEGASVDESAYDLGYRQGGRDLNTHESADYSRHKRSYGAATEQSFATGYSDGFSGAPNRYGAPEARQWMRQDDPD